MMEWQVDIRPCFDKLGNDVIFYQKLTDGRIDVYDPSTNISTVVPLGASIKPQYFPDGLLEALFELMQSKGHKPKAQSFVEGKLEAQSEHLKDLKKLLKL